LIAAAAAAVIGIAYVTVPREATHNPRVRELVQAMPRDHRYVEARLSGGFRWAPLQNVSRDAGDPLDAGEMKVIGAAGDVLEQTSEDSSLDAQHARGVAHLLAGWPAEADALLTKVAEAKKDAAIWNDLAAARFTAGTRTDDASQLASALAAADEALRIDPASPEALFNRALIVERLGLRQQARAAWERYLAVDATSDWAREARERLAALVPPSVFGEELDRNYDQLSRDVKAANALVRMYPQEARTWGETEILGRWADALKAGNDSLARKHLTVAAFFGEELKVLHGDCMLHEAVASITAAAPERQATLADGHLHFRSAQAAYKRGHTAEAHELFRKAARAFARGGSPAALLAEYFQANTLFERGRIEEARVRLEQLLADAPPEFAAHRAQTQWQLGLVLASQAQWGTAIDTLSEGIRTFERLGEMKYAMSVRNILAEIYDRIGDPRSAWQHRIVVLRELGRTTHPRLLPTLDAAARGAALTQDWAVSLALLGLKLEMAADGADDPLYVHTLLLRARIEAMLFRPTSAQAELARATAAMARLHDDAYRERAEADRAAVEGFLAQSPSAAISSLGEAIAFHRTKGRRMLLPDLLLQRGRAFVRAGDRHRAAADFEAGIRELEVQRSSIDPGEERWGVFGAVDELFDEAMQLALARDDDAAAFAYAERARARELLETVSLDDATSAAGADGTVVVEYATHAAGLVIFVVDGGRITAVQTQVARPVLENEIARMSASVVGSNAAEFRRNATILYMRLVAPVAAALPRDRLLVFVPDALLRGIPFAALLDEQGTYVIERQPLVVTPSYAVFAKLTARQKPAVARPHLLVVAGPAATETDVSHLRASSRESDSVEAVYASADRLRPGETTEALFATRARAADVIHFVGHAVSNARFPAALMTARRDGSDGRIDVREIAAMQLHRTRVVVLAACSTARGQERSGEGNISIARAFLAAGVPSVVGTLWPIDEGPAAEFFPRLHRYFTDGLPLAEALRRAQLEAIRNDDAPKMWAAVQIFGS
jgi:CHAT domain-containing protein/tetratricopeptide (TPR) repeat protein